MDSSTMMYIWLGVIIFFGVLEAITVSITSIWFSAGALVAMIATGFGAPFWLQILLFIIVTSLLLYITRPLVKRFIVPRIHRTNADGLIGQTAVVTEDIDNTRETGAVHIGGKTWTARTEDGEILLADTKVKVLRIEGVKLFVSAADAENK